MDVKSSDFFHFNDIKFQVLLVEKGKISFFNISDIYDVWEWELDYFEMKVEKGEVTL